MAARAQLRRLDREPRVLSEDGGLELAEERRWLESQIGSKEPARLSIDRKCLGLPPDAIEREHELGPKALTQGMLGSERLEFGNDVGVPPESKIGFDPLFECDEPKLVEARDLVLCE